MVNFSSVKLFWFLKEEEKEQKKFDGPHIKLVSQQNELDPGWFSALITCANEATLTYQFNYINVKLTVDQTTSCKCDTLVTS